MTNIELPLLVPSNNIYGPLVICKLSGVDNTKVWSVV